LDPAKGKIFAEIRELKFVGRKEEGFREQKKEL